MKILHESKPLFFHNSSTFVCPNPFSDFLLLWGKEFFSLVMATNSVLGRPCSKDKYGIKNIGSKVCAYIKAFSAFIFHRCSPVFLIKYCIVLCLGLN